MKSTDDLMNELSKESCKINRYLKNNPDSFVYENIHNFWESVIKMLKFIKNFFYQTRNLILLTNLISAIAIFTML